VERESGENDLKSSSSLPLHVQRRRSCTVPFKPALCRFFFEKKRKKTWRDPKIGYDRIKFNSVIFQDQNVTCKMKLEYFS
jgi:hypothetical protein